MTKSKMMDLDIVVVNRPDDKGFRVIVKDGDTGKATDEWDYSYGRNCASRLHFVSDRRPYAEWVLHSYYKDVLGFENPLSLARMALADTNEKSLSFTRLAKAEADTLSKNQPLFFEVQVKDAARTVENANKRSYVEKALWEHVDKGGSPYTINRNNLMTVTQNRRYPKHTISPLTVRVSGHKA